MKNTSIEQLNKEVVTAKKQALSDPYRYERPDQVGTADGNTLTEIVQMKKQQARDGKLTFPADVRAKVLVIFDKFPEQLKTLGLYYDGGFTVEEIAEREKSEVTNVARSLRRAKNRLKKYLSPEEYNSIRRFIGDHKPALDATQDRHVNPFYNDFVDQQPIVSYQWDGNLTPKVNFLCNHPAPKNLPKGSFYYEVQSIETGTTGGAH